MLVCVARSRVWPPAARAEAIERKDLPKEKVGREAALSPSQAQLNKQASLAGSRKWFARAPKMRKCCDFSLRSTNSSRALPSSPSSRLGSAIESERRERAQERKKGRKRATLVGRFAGERVMASSSAARLREEEEEEDARRTLLCSAACSHE